MPDGRPDHVALSTEELRAVTRFAAACAAVVLEVFEAGRPEDVRPREAIAAAERFAGGGDRGRALRDTAWAALRAAQDAGTPAAREAARAAMAAAGAAYLHPLAHATQVRHLLGSAAHAAHAAELADRGGPDEGTASLAAAAERAGPTVVAVLRRYPPAPAGGGRVGELVRRLDAALRCRR
ncbi:putative immunity protein [Blastococcus sp. SYSU D00820]